MSRELSEQEKKVFEAFNHFAHTYRSASCCSEENIDFRYRDEVTQGHARFLIKLAETSEGQRELKRIIAKLCHKHHYPTRIHKNFLKALMFFEENFDQALVTLTDYLDKAPLVCAQPYQPKPSFNYGKYWCNIFTGGAGQKIGIAGLALGGGVMAMSNYLAPLVRYLPVMTSIPPAQLVFWLGLTLLALSAVVYGISIARALCKPPVYNDTKPPQEPIALGAIN